MTGPATMMMTRDGLAKVMTDAFNEGFEAAARRISPCIVVLTTDEHRAALQAAREEGRREAELSADPLRTIPLPTPLTPTPLEVAAARLVSMVDNGTDALTVDMHAACDEVRLHLPKDGR